MHAPDSGRYLGERSGEMPSVVPFLMIIYGDVWFEWPLY